MPIIVAVAGISAAALLLYYVYVLTKGSDRARVHFYNTFLSDGTCDTGNSVRHLHKKVMEGEKTFLSKIFTPCENLIYKVMRIKKEE